MLPYAATIFLSAFLLFLVQPLIAKQILPWFGGASSVWTTCLLFFQSVLLAGYAYAHAVVTRLSSRTQVIVHIALLCTSLAFLPIVADVSWKPMGNEDPILRILGLLLVTIGVPYLLLSSTTPLLQAWYWRRFNQSVPYRLFALSNFASLLALLGYPLAIEPFVGTAESAGLWSWLYGGFVAACIATGILSLGSKASTFHPDTQLGNMDGKPSSIPWRTLGSWLLYAALGSCVLLAVSNHLTQNIASVPFLWVVPLALYLITFIICFDHPKWYLRSVFMPLLGISLLVMAWMIDSLELQWAAPIFAMGLFASCMFCHGELARLKPSPEHLTLYYLAISIGGAMGALLIAVAAPTILHGYFEMQGVLVIISALLLGHALKGGKLLAGAAILILGGVCVLVGNAIHSYAAGVREMERNFYGVVRTRDWQEPSPYRAMYHGAINHGGQYLDPDKRMHPSSYFGLTSGYGRLLKSMEGPRKVGVIGLGAGALLSYSRAGDEWVFYEIDPGVVDVAKREFSYMRDTRAKLETVVADGRLALERESSRGFDVLGIDAFSGDSIPMHLITREAMALYIKHIKPDGAIVFQATNRYVDLMPVIRRLADEFGMQTAWVSDWAEGGDYWTSTTDQVIVTRNRKLLELPLVKSASEPAPQRKDLPIFTDDYYNMLRILK